MATTTERYQAELVADDQMSKVFKGVQDAQAKLSKGFQNMQKDAGDFGKAFAVIAGAGVLAIKTFIDAATESERGTAQLNAVIKSTGAVAGITAVQAQKLATELQKTTTVTDEAVVAGENVLLTYTKIGKDVFPTATKTLVDMATAMNNGATPSAEELSAKAVLLGKALNDPTKGLAALARVGVQFTDQQKKQIETMQKTGNIIGAQKLILDQLSQKYGGSAAAAAKTFSGQIENMNNRLGELEEDIGRAIIPILSKFLDVMDGMLQKFESLTPAQKDFIAQSLLIGTALAGIVAGALLVVAALNPITIAVAAVVVAFGYLTAKLAEQGMSWEEFGISLQTTWNEAVYNVTAAIDHIIFELRRLTLATDQELQAMADDMNKDLTQKYSLVKDGYSKLNTLQQDNLTTQKKNLEDSIAAQRDIVDKSNGDQKKTEREKLDSMKADALKQFSDLKLGSTAELAKMRTAESAELDKRNKMYQEKLGATAEQAGVWGAHFLQNLIGGIESKFPALSVAIGAAKKTMEFLKFSKNPNIPSEIWGAHFVENFAAGMQAAAPKVFDGSQKMKDILVKEYGDNGAIPNLLKEWTKDKSIDQHFAEIAATVQEQTDKVNADFKKQSDDYKSLNESAGQSLKDLEEKHKSTLDSINSKIAETKASINDLNKNYMINIQSVNTGVGEKVVEQQDLVKSLQDQVNQGIANGDDVTALKAQLAQESAALADFMKTASAYSADISEARRRASETDFQRSIEDAMAQKKQINDDFNDKMKKLTDETAALQVQTDAENVLYDQKKAAYALLTIAFQNMQSFFVTGLSTMQSEAEAKINHINGLLASLKNAMNNVSGSVGVPLYDSNGVSTVKPKGFADGGISTGSTNGHFELLHGSEAVVPLPNGRSIPVDIKGTGDKQITVNLNFGGVNIAKEVDGDNLLRRIKDDLTRTIQLSLLGSH